MCTLLTWPASGQFTGILLSILYHATFVLKHILLSTFAAIYVLYFRISYLQPIWLHIILPRNSMTIYHRISKCTHAYLFHALPYLPYLSRASTKEGRKMNQRDSVYPTHSYCFAGLNCLVN
jgi:hypothetical protein